MARCTTRRKPLRAARLPDAAIGRANDLRPAQAGDLRPAQADDLLEAMPDGVVVVDSAGRLVYANRRTEQLTGYQRSELLGRRIELLVPSRLRLAHREHRRAYQARGGGRRAMGSVDRDFRVRRKDGTEFSADIALGPIRSGSARQTVAVIRDVGDRRKLEADLEHRALHDPLTDLPNRALFFDRLKQALLAGRREGRRVALAMLDLDGFKAVNDAYGHAAGDAVLRELGVRLQSGVRAVDTVARLGGDEFAWILTRVSAREAAARTVGRFVRSLSGPYSWHRHRIEVGMTAGVALYPEDGHDVDTLIRNADLALYTSKRGRRRVR
jgi:diguanylate cyclase (GGDEF)-like protein/PAS domain S-box-containing protein